MTHMIDVHEEPRSRWPEDNGSHSDFRSRIKRDSRKIAGALEGIRDYTLSIQHELAGIRQNLEHIALAQMKQAGIMHVYWDEDGQLQAAPTLAHIEADVPPTPRAYVDVGAQVHGSSGGPLGWVSRAPAPYNGVVIVCSPDDGGPAGIRCHAEVALPGGERKKYTLNWSEE